MRLVWTGTALADRRVIYDHIEAENPAAAVALDETFSRRAAQLPFHPFAGRPGRVEGTRELVVHRQYILIYDTKDDAVRVLRILHAARQWPPDEAS